MFYCLGDYGEFGDVSPLYSRKIHVSVKEFQELMKTSGDNEHPLEKLEALLEVIIYVVYIYVDIFRLTLGIVNL